MTTEIQTKIAEELAADMLKTIHEDIKQTMETLDFHKDRLKKLDKAMERVEEALNEVDYQELLNIADELDFGESNMRIAKF